MYIDIGEYFTIVLYWVAISLLYWPAPNSKKTHLVIFVLFCDLLYE